VRPHEKSADSRQYWIRYRVHQESCGVWTRHNTNGCVGGNVGEEGNFQRGERICARSDLVSRFAQEARSLARSPAVSSISCLTLSRSFCEPMAKQIPAQAAIFSNRLASPLSLAVAVAVTLGSRLNRALTELITITETTAKIEKMAGPRPKSLNLSFWFQMRS